MKTFSKYLAVCSPLILLCGLCSSLSIVQSKAKADKRSASFTGKLFRSDTHAPIAGAKMMLMGGKISDSAPEANSGTDGNFSFESVPEGKYTLSIQVAYQKQEDVPCQFLMGRIKNEKDSTIVVVSEKEKFSYRIFIKGLALKAGKPLSKEYDLACVSAFGG